MVVVQGVLWESSEGIDMITDFDIGEDEEAELREYFSSDHLFSCAFCSYSHKPDSLA